MAVPEVDLVISIRPDALLDCLQGRWAKENGPRGPGARRGNGALPKDLDLRKLQKSAIRACTDRLVGPFGGFKFRRSAFRESVPKVIVIAPATPEGKAAVPLTISVNAVTPLYLTALLTECGHMDARARDLILLVKRWAKDRGLCHTSRGYLSPYAWALLTIYFLQVFESPEESQILPPLEAFKVSSGLLAKGGSSSPGGPLTTFKRDPADPAPSAPAAAAAQALVGRVSGASVPSSAHSTSALFAAFVQFYAQGFDWRNEAISVRLGKRAPPDLKLPLHILSREDGSTQVGPSIEDPFEKGQNLGACTTAESLKRLREEFSRAQELCLQGASLTDLLEPWAPEAPGGEEDHQEEQ